MNEDVFRRLVCGKSNYGSRGPIDALSVFLFDEAVGGDCHTIGARLDILEFKLALSVGC
jgi:hypothetical protein